MASAENEQDQERGNESTQNIINISSSVVLMTLQQQENNQATQFIGLQQTRDSNEGSTTPVARASNGDFVKLADQDRSRDRAEAKMAESSNDEAHEIFQELYNQLDGKWEKLKVLFRMAECDVMGEKYRYFTRDLSAMDSVLHSADLDEMVALSQRLKPFPQIFLSCVALRRITSTNDFDDTKEELKSIEEWLELIKSASEEISSSCSDQHKTKNKLISITVGRYLEELDMKRRQMGIDDEFKVESSAWFLRCIAFAYFHAGELRDSAKYSLKVEDMMTDYLLREQAEKKRILVISLNNAAFCYARINEKEKAKELLERALEISDRVTDWESDEDKELTTNISRSNLQQLIDSLR